MIANSEPTGSFSDDVPPLPAVLAELRAAHLWAAALTAELDLDHTGLWEQADDIVADLSTEAYDVTAVVTGEPATGAAVLATPIVRLRELAVAQSRLFAALNGATQSEQSTGTVLAAAYRSARRVRMLGGRLQRAQVSPMDWVHRREARNRVGDPGRSVTTRGAAAQSHPEEASTAAPG